MGTQRPLQSTWQRIVLLVVLGYEGLGALVGGVLLAAAPDGRYMKIPVAVMHGAFPDFRVPGIILFGLGLLGTTAFVAVLRRSRADWIAASLTVGGFAVWFFVEIVILRELHWLHVMWGYPVILGGLVAVPLLPFPRATMRNAWLACGVLSSLLYAAMSVLVAAEWPAYQAASQTVSELSAVGAPTRPLWVVLALVYALLVIAFGWGVRLAAGEQRRLRLAGTLIVVYGALGFVWPFAPMHLREVLARHGGTFSDTLHLVLGGLTELVYLAALAVAAAALGAWFRAYSVATFIALFAFGALMFRDGPALGAGQPTPLIGVWERINMGLFLLWVIVLALVLLRRLHPREGRAPLPGPARPAFQGAGRPE